MVRDNGFYQTHGLMASPVFFEHICKSGISKFKLYKYVRENGLSRSAVVFILRERIGSMSCMCFIRDARMLASHDEAFYYHGLTDREPFVHTLTIYSGYNAHRLTADGSCKVYTVKRELLDVGKIIVKDNDGIPVFPQTYRFQDSIHSISHPLSSVFVRPVPLDRLQIFRLYMTVGEGLQGRPDSVPEGQSPNASMPYMAA